MAHHVLHVTLTRGAMGQLPAFRPDAIVLRWRHFEHDFNDKVLAMWLRAATSTRIETCVRVDKQSLGDMTLRVTVHVDDVDALRRRHGSVVDAELTYPFEFVGADRMRVLVKGPKTCLVYTETRHNPYPKAPYPSGAVPVPVDRLAVPVSFERLAGYANTAAALQWAAVGGVTIDSVASVIVKRSQYAGASADATSQRAYDAAAVTELFIGQVPYDMVAEALRRALESAAHAPVYGCDTSRSGAARITVAKDAVPLFLELDKQLIFGPAGLMRIDCRAFPAWAAERDRRFQAATGVARRGLSPLVIESAQSPTRDPVVVARRSAGAAAPAVARS